MLLPIGFLIFKANCNCSGKGDLVINVPCTVEKNNNGCSLGQLRLGDTLGACDQTVLKGTDGTRSRRLELKIWQAGVFPAAALILTVPGSLPGLRESHFSWECQTSYESFLQMHLLFLPDDFFPTMFFPLHRFYSWEQKLGNHVDGGVTFWNWIILFFFRSFIVRWL